MTEDHTPKPIRRVDCPILDRNGHAFDKRTRRCIHCGIGYWEAVAEAVKEQPN